MRIVILFILFIAFNPVTAQIANYRFAWLSDIHIGSTTGSEDLRRSINDINTMNDIAFVVISGDITETGSDAELHEAYNLLCGLRKPWYAVPGNHDTKWSESGCTTFPKLFGNDRFVFDFGGSRFIGLHQGPRMRMGDGHWAPEDMRWLDSVLTAIPDRQIPLFFVTHYPVDSSISNWCEMLNRVRKYNTKAILHGHGHRNRASDFNGIPGIMGRSNLRAGSMVGGYTIGEIRNDSLFVSERVPGVSTSQPWHTLPLRGLPDRAVCGVPPDTLNIRYPEVHTLWRRTSGWTIASSPVVAGTSVYVSDASGSVRSLKLADGSEQWRFSTRGPVFSTPVVSNNRIVFGSADSNIYCLDAATGNLLWTFRTGKAVLGSASFSEEVSFIGGSDGVFRALDSSGNTTWEYRGIDGFVETRPLVHEGKVIFGAWDGHLYALDERTGSLVWKWAGEGQGVLLSPAACVPVAAHGKVFIVAPDRRMTAINMTTGKTVWRTAKHQVRESIGISGDGKRIYVRTMRDSIIAISTTSDQPEAVWITDAGFGYDHNYAALVEKDGTLFYGTRYGRLLALDAKSGRIKWQYNTGNALLNTVASVDAKSVVVTNVDGDVMMIGTK